MSAKVNLESALRPIATVTNIGFNALTKLFYSCLNPNQDRKGLAATFHYDCKVILYNFATVILGYNVARIALGKRSLGSNIIEAAVALFVRSVMEQTLSAKSGAKVMVRGAWNQLTGNEDLDGSSILENGYSSICVAYSKLLSRNKNPAWKENMLEIQGFPILKNWSRTVPDLIKTIR
jgi:hypothetical protein